LRPFTSESSTPTRRPVLFILLVFCLVAAIREQVAAASLSMPVNPLSSEMRSLPIKGVLDGFRSLHLGREETDELKEELNALNKRRATSKYLDKAGEKSFIVVDEGRFREYVLDKLKEVEAAVMGAET